MKQILLIINPISGNKASIKIESKVIDTFKSNNYEVDIIYSKYKGHIEKILNSYDLSLYIFCCIMGGDGSIHEAVNGLLKRQDKNQIPLSIVPAGSGNSLARDLNVLDISNALERILNLDIKEIDIAKLYSDKQNIFSFNIIGWGMVANIGIKSEKFRWLGSSRYTILSILELIFKKAYKVNIELIDEKNNKKVINNKMLFAVLCNTIHTGKGMKIAPDAKLNDGLLNLYIIKNASRFKLLSLLPKLFDGKHVNDKLVESYKFSKIKINEDYERKLLIDGEIKGKTPITVEVIHKGIKLIY
tara:strand:+ start:3657 stop:4559 length:903 start_codon:yes stop_codon:yes gene_type:complete